MSNVSAEVERLVKQTVVERLHPTVIESVAITADEDHDGDPILIIEVVVADGQGNLDSSKVVSLTRLIREKLSRVDESRFPRLSFSTVSEIDDEAA